MAIGAGAVGEGGDVGEDGFAGVEDAVLIDVMEDEALDESGFDEAEVSGEALHGLARAGAEGDGEVFARGDDHGAGDARGGAGDFLFGDLRDVVSWGKVFEEVLAREAVRGEGVGGRAVTGDFDPDDGVFRIDVAIAVGVGVEDDGAIGDGAGTTGEVGFVGESIAVGVIPEEVADAAGELVAEVGGEDGLARGGTDFPDVVGGRVGDEGAA